MKYLTQEEVDALPDGTQVIITWSGGNGPHQYKTKAHNNTVYVLSNVTGEINWNSPINFVGEQQPRTQVSLYVGTAAGSSPPLLARPDT